MIGLLGMLLLLGVSPDEEALLAPIRVEAQRQAAEVGEEAVVEFVKMPRVEVPARACYVVDGVEGKRWRGVSTVMVAAVEQGSRTVRFPVTVRVRTYGRALVALRPFEFHEALSAGDVAVHRVETTSLREGYVGETCDVGGHRTRRMIREGSVLLSSMIERMPDVRQGDPVVLMVTRGGVKISRSVIARDDGRMGETIGVKAEGVHAVIAARVVDAHTVTPVDGMERASIGNGKGNQ
jgi:flagella basal body P-ring formation protein FlgA